MVNATTLRARSVGGLAGSCERAAAVRARGVWLAAVVSIVSASADADTIYVDATLSGGCSTYDVASRSCGTGTRLALDTLAAAHTAARPGDTVILRGGLHLSSLYAPIVPSGTVADPIVYRGMVGERAVVSCGTDVRNSNGGLGGPFRLFGSAYVTIEHLEIRNCYDGVVSATDTAHPIAPHHLTLRNLEIHECLHGIRLLMGTHHVTVSDLIAHHNGQFVGPGRSGGGTGVHIGEASDVRLERVTVHHIDDGAGGAGEGDGFHVDAPTGTHARRITFADCTARDNGEDGFDLSGDEVLIERSTAEDNYNGFKLWDDHAWNHQEVYRFSLRNVVAIGNTDAALVAANGPHVELYNGLFALSYEGARFMRGTVGAPDYENTPPTAVLENNIFVGNSGFGRRFDANDQDDRGWVFHSDHSLFFGNGDDAFRWRGEGPASRTVDPGLTDLPAHDLALTSTSPARGAARVLSASFTDDRAGRTRTTWDIGPFAYVALADAGVDSGDGGRDAGETSHDGGLDAGEGSSDGGLDGGLDAGDSSIDAGFSTPDGGLDAGIGRDPVTGTCGCGAGLPPIGWAALALALARIARIGRPTRARCRTGARLART